MSKYIVPRHPPVPFCMPWYQKRDTQELPPCQRQAYADPFDVWAQSIFVLRLLRVLEMLIMLVTNNPQRDAYSNKTGSKGDPVCGAVALNTVVARSLAIGTDHAVAVVRGAVKEVENVGREDGRQRHEAPVLAQAVDAKRLGDDGWEHAKEEAIAEAGETGNEGQKVGVADVEGADLREKEDETGQDQAPDTTDVKGLDQIVRANA